MGSSRCPNCGLRMAKVDQEKCPRCVVNPGRMGSNAVGSAGKNNMIYGALFCVGGIVVTVATYIAAGSSGYVVALGPILFGATQFLRGMNQLGGE